MNCFSFVIIPHYLHFFNSFIKFLTIFAKFAIVKR